ncbi:MAG: hypothetical protein ACYDHP_05820 [Ferrimicrobium sp.]
MTAVSPTAPKETRSWRQLLFLAVLAGNVFVWFHNGLPIGFSDGGLQTMLYHPLSLLREALFPWTDSQLGGVPTYSNVALVPLYLLGAALRLVNFPTWLIQAVFWYLIEFGSMVAIRAWLRRLFNEHPQRDAIATIAAVFYAFNIMTGLTYWFWDKLNITVIVCVPVLLLAIEWSLSATLRRATAGMAAAVFLSASLFLDGEFVGPVAALCVIYWIVRIVQTSESSRALLRTALRTMSAGALALIANTWFLVPFLTTASGYYSAANAQINTAASIQGATSEATWSGLVRFLPFGAGNGGVWLYKTPWWRVLYSTPAFWGIALTVVGVLVVGAVGSRLRSQRLLLAAIFLVGFLLQAGAKGPFGWAVLFLVEHVTFGQALRTPWRDLAPFTLVGASALFGLGVVAIGHACGHRQLLRRFIIGGLVFVTCGVYAFPMWTGQIVGGPITERGKPYIASYVSIPPVYNEVRSFLRTHMQNSRVLALPISPTSYLTMKWPSGYDGSDQRWLLYGVPTLSYTALGATPAASILAPYVNKASPVDFASLLQSAGDLSCRYIVVDSAVTTKRGGYYGQILHSPAYYLKGLERLGLKPVMTRGTLTVFRMPGRYFHPLAYGIHLSGTSRSSAPSSALQVTPTSWDLPIKSGGRWIVVLGETNAPGWTAKVTINGHSIQGHHVVVDGFANGWTFNLPHLSTAVDIQIAYGPEHLDRLATALALAVWALIALSLFVPPLSPRRHRRASRDVLLVPRQPTSTTVSSMAVDSLILGILLYCLLAPDLFATPHHLPRASAMTPKAALHSNSTIEPIFVTGNTATPKDLQTFQSGLPTSSITVSGAGKPFDPGGPQLIRMPPISSWSPPFRKWRLGVNNITFTITVPPATHYALLLSGHSTPVPLAQASRIASIQSSMQSISGSVDRRLRLVVPIRVSPSLVSLRSSLIDSLGNCTQSAGGQVGRSITASIATSRGNPHAATLILRSTQGTACVNAPVASTSTGPGMLLSFSSTSENAHSPVVCLYSAQRNACLDLLSANKASGWVQRTSLLYPTAPVSAIYFYAVSAGAPNEVRIRGVSLRTVQEAAKTLAVITSGGAG